MAAWRQEAAAHEASAFKVDEDPVLVVKAEVRTTRPRRLFHFTSLTHLIAAASGRPSPLFVLIAILRYASGIITGCPSLPSICKALLHLQCAP